MPYPIGLQLYSLRREFDKDAENTLRRVPTLGYRAIEMAGRYGWSLAQWQALLAETKLVVLGAHVGLDALEKDLAAEVAFQKGVGNRRLVMPWLAESHRTKKGYASVAAQLNHLAQELRAHDMELLYHNHDFEFTRFTEGGCGFDVLLNETDPALVRFEVDTYWVERGGLNSRDFITANASRIGMIHAKELRTKDLADVPAGQGNVDFVAITSLAKKKQWPVIVEFEGDNASEAVAASARYLSSLLSQGLCP